MFLYELSKSFIEFTKRVTNPIQLFSHYSIDVFKSLFHLAIGYFVFECVGDGATCGVFARSGQNFLLGSLLSALCLGDVGVDVQITQDLLQKILPEDHLHVL